MVAITSATVSVHSHQNIQPAVEFKVSRLLDEANVLLSRMTDSIGRDWPGYIVCDLQLTLAQVTAVRGPDLNYDLVEGLGRGGVKGRLHYL